MTWTLPKKLEPYRKFIAIGSDLCKTVEESREGNAYPIMLQVCLLERLVDAGMFERMQWVSVKDRLPEDDTDVLCAYDFADNSPFTACYYEHRRGFCVHGVLIKNITHWMPLPSPPKE